MASNVTPAVSVNLITVHQIREALQIISATSERAPVEPGRVIRTEVKYISRLLTAAVTGRPVPD
jgi:hypothetical protein